MKIAVVLPRGMDFSEGKATSIDLCAYDFVIHSRYRASTLLLGAASGTPLDGVRFENILPAPFGSPSRRLSALVAALRAYEPDVIVVHQHLPTAAAVARRLQPTPIILHRHNYENKRRGRIHHFIKTNQYRKLAGIILVSNSVHQHYVENWPALAGRARVVHNGLDVQSWQAGQAREAQILFVGRAVPEKGALEAVLSMRDALKTLPAWTGSVILSGLRENPAYSVRLRQEIEAAGPQLRFYENLAFPKVKKAFETAAIALVPSVWQEPFGRTALEAHAGGAALISSGRGGLAEVSGDAALYADPSDVPALTRAITSLAEKPDQRAALAAAGRQRAVSMFSIQDKAAELDDEFERLHRALARNRTGASRH
jgi:glycosyltransferase involved in cell wall biosynthesis